MFWNVSFLLLAAVFFGGALTVYGQTTTPLASKEAVSAATFRHDAASLSKLLKKGKTKEAGTILKNLKPGNPGERSSKFFLEGLLLVKLGKFKEAKVANDHAVAENPSNFAAYFNNACILSLQEKKVEAVSYLAKLESHVKDSSVRKKYANQLVSDSDLAILRNDPDFKKILSKFSGEYSEKGGTLNVFQKISSKNPGITPEDVEFVDRSFRKFGNVNDPAMGDYSGGLEKISKSVPMIQIEKNTEFFFGFVRCRFLGFFCVN